MAAQDDPDLAREALAGLAAYEAAERPAALPRKPEIARVGCASLLDHGGSGPPAILIPSLINPPNVLDLDPDVSLASAVARMGRRALLLDWGDAARRADLSVSDHIETLLVPLIDRIGEPVALIGYCLGGTMAVGAANFASVESVVTLAAPWRFRAYPQSARDDLLGLWRNARPAAEAVGALPMEVLQAAFWSLDPKRTVAKFAHFANLDPAGAEARRFVQLEDWANQGEPLPLPAARELIEDFFGGDVPGRGLWELDGRIVTDRAALPALHFTAAHDKITPAAAAPDGNTIRLVSGHVGMVVGSARLRLHAELKPFLATACR